ncbi:hypothetical protein V1272_005358 [Bradyrhizobium sp. AZCC 1708]
MVAGTISAWTCNDSIASVSSEEELENPSVRYLLRLLFGATSQAEAGRTMATEPRRWAASD